MPGLHQKSFNKYASRFYDKNEALADHFSHKTLLILNEAHRKIGLQPDADNCLQIAVSFDGFWLTRGHKSLIGIGAVIDILTGLVIDTHVLSLHCQICATTGAKIKKEKSNNYEQWLQEHKESGSCTINFEGVSGMMEVEAATVLWARSVEKFRLKYTIFVGDGDSKAYNKVCDLAPYGPDVEIEKEECLNHVGKRMGAALRNVVSDCSKRGITLGGRGSGRLTANAIRKLSIYYTRGIRSHDTAAEMKKAILASLHHCYSTDEHPQHSHCPSGPDSWCFFKKGLARHQFVFGHKKRVHTPLNFDLLHKHLMLIYERLTADNLLSRCERKANQNANESFHSSVWARCGKTVFHSKKKVQLAVVSAAAEYNFGPSSSLHLKNLLSIPSGENASRLSECRAKKRLTKSLERSQAAEKKRKRMRKEAIERAQREATEEEAAAYAPGMH
ncbi:hypothetical protein RRG08_017863 [Elysia crispata]|uniref:Mutator-like transposase domain-containing protein n=1 Tax=Elysia crispata TaxID=231223 RepID=A0AAE1CJX0_9GAST|nr:hypothetical protein RRG08_017863 [Elysia crispata]